MVTIIKKGTKRAELDKKLEQISSSKKLDAQKFVGTISLKEDPIEIQRKLRNEWE